MNGKEIRASVEHVRFVASAVGAYIDALEGDRDELNKIVVRLEAELVEVRARLAKAHELAEALRNLLEMGQPLCQFTDDARATLAEWEAVS